MNQKSVINSAKTRTEWQRISGDASKYYETMRKAKLGDVVNVNGQNITVTEQNYAFFKNFGKSAKSLVSDMSQLAGTRKATIKQMLINSKNDAVVNTYNGETKNTIIGKFLKLVAPDSNAGWLSKTWFWVKQPFGLAWKAFGITFKPYNLVQNSAAGTWYKIESTFIVPVYEVPMFKDKLGMGDRVATVTIPMKDQSGQMVEQEVQLTKEMKESAKDESKKIAEEITKLGKEYRALA